MKIQTPATILACLFLCCSCAGVTREQAIAIAHREVARQHRVLPAHYTVDVGEGVFQSEIDRPEPLWEVTFYSPRRHGRRELYTVMLDRRAGAVRIFSDPRDTVQSAF